MKLLAATKVMLARHGVHTPIWNTEVNYGLSGSSAVRLASSDRQVGNVLRTYVLNAENGVRRVYWYSWDLQGLANTALVQPDRVTLTPAGRAFAAVRAWLLGTRPVGCTRDGKGTWTCSFSTATQMRRVFWNPTRSVTTVAPRGTRTVASWDTAPVSRRAGATIHVGVVPVLVRTTR